MIHRFLILLIAALLLSSQSHSYGQAVLLKIDTVNASCTATGNIRVPMRVRNFANVGSFQFSVGWNTAQLQYQYITKGAANNPFFGGGANASFDTVTFKPTGKFSFQWNKVGGLTVPDTTVVFYMVFKRNGGAFSGLNFLSGAAAPLQVEVTDPLGDELLSQVVSGGIASSDTQPPVISCPQGVAQTVSGPTVVNGIAPSNVADNCSSVQVTWSAAGATTVSNPGTPNASGTTFNPGMTTVTYRATDVAGLTSTCSFTINLQPSSLSDTLTVIAGSGNGSCGQSIGIDITTLNFEKLGSLQFTVAWDKTQLLFNNITTTGSAINNMTFDTIGSRNKGYLTFSWVTNSLNGTTIADGALLFRINFSPASSNITGALVQFTDVPTPREATVQPPMDAPVIFVPGLVNATDNVPPTVTCPANKTQTAPTGTFTANITGTAPTALTDNCGGTVALAYARTGTTTGQGMGNADGVYNAGSTTVTYTATDTNGNTATCSFNVLVNADKPVSVEIDSLVADCNADTVLVPIFVADFADIVGMSFSIKWDTSLLQFVAVDDIYPSLNLSDINFQNYLSTPAGLLQFLAADPLNGWPDIPDGGTIFALRFKVKKSGTAPIEFTGNSEAVNSGLNTVPLALTNGSIASSKDLIGPIFTTCPADIVVLGSGPNCEATVILPPANATDDCAGIDTVTSNQVDSIFEAGTTTVIYTAKDKAGNSALCVFMVRVDPNPALSVFNNCPANITLDAPTGQCAAVADWTAPTPFNPCGLAAPMVNVNFQPGSSFNIGATQVQYQLVGATATCSFTVTVRDRTAPTVTCPPNQIVTAQNTDCGATALWPNATATDACDATLAPVSTPASGTFFAPGINTIVFSATDDENNTGTCSFTVTVQETVPPTLNNCPADIKITLTQTKCDTAVTWIVPTATDNCAVQSLQANLAPGATFKVGNTTVEYTATDASGNTAVCSFKVEITDGSAPTLSNCPTKLAIELPADRCDTVLVWTAPTAIDNCKVDTLYSDIMPGAVFIPGLTVIQYTAADAAGNTATCAFDVEVIDLTAPVIGSCPSDISVELPPNKCDTVLTWDIPLVFDNCAVDTIMADAEPGNVFTPGTSVVTYLALDIFGNTATCAFAIEVRDVFEPVIFDCPANIAIELPETLCDTAVLWDVPTAVDNCVLDTLIGDTDPGAVFAPGVSTVTYLALDSYGNTAICSFEIEVIDVFGPKFDGCPADITTDLAPTECETDVTWQAPVAMDNCGLGQVTSTHQPGDIFQAGTTKVQYTVESADGKTDTCTFNVVVRDLLPPQISNCPSDVLVQLPLNQCDTLVNWFEPVALDNCGFDSLNTTHEPPSRFQAGQTTVVYTAKDKSGNVATCSFMVLVIDQVPPVFISCPKDTTLTGSGNCGVPFTWTLPPASDNCTPQPDIIVTASHPTIDTFYGNTKIVIVAKDASNNYDTCIFNVKVLSSGVPSLQNVPQDLTFTGCSAVASWTPPTPAGFCTPPTVTSTHKPGDTFQPGTTTVVYTATDQLGLSYSASFKVTVNEPEAPKISCPKGEIVLNTAGVILQDSSGFVQATDTVSGCTKVRIEYNQPAATDNCGAPVLTQKDGPLSGGIFSIGRDTLVFEAKDPAGNISLCSIQINVKGLDSLKLNISPLPACQGSQVVLTVDSFANTTVTYTWTGPAGTYPNQPKINVFPLNQGNSGAYSVRANINGCLTPTTIGQVLMVTKPDAVDDINFLIEPNTLDTFDVLANDVFFPATDIKITQLGPTPTGLTYLQDGLFAYQANPRGEAASFLYEICSKACPDLCDMATVTISVRQDSCIIPNVITPNGDALNDFLDIPCLSTGRYVSNSIVIYNKWGDKVYESAPYISTAAGGWQGTLNGDPGKPLPDDTYYYIFKPSPSDKPIKGFVQIFR